MKKSTKLFALLLISCLVFAAIAIIALADSSSQEQIQTIRNYKFEDDKTPSTSNGSSASTYRSLSVVDSTKGNKYLRFAQKKVSTGAYTTAFLIGNTNPSKNEIDSATLLSEYDYFTVDFDLASDKCFVFVGYEVAIDGTTYSIKEVYNTYTEIDEKKIKEDIDTTFDNFKIGIQSGIDNSVISGYTSADDFLRKTAIYVEDAQAENLSSSVSVDDALSSAKLAYSEGMAFAFDNRPVIYNSDGSVNSLSSAGSTVVLRIYVRYNENDSKWHFSIETKSVDGGEIIGKNDFVLADGLGEWNHFTYAVKVDHQNQAKSTVNLYYNGYLIATSYINRNENYYTKGESEINIATRGVEFKINDYTNYYSFAIDNYNSTYYKRGYSPLDQDGIDKLFAGQKESISQCSDVVYNKNYVMPYPNNNDYIQIDGREKIYVPYLLEDALGSIKNNSTVKTGLDLLDMNPSSWVSYDIICNPEVRATLSELSASKGVTIEKTTLGYRVNGAKTLANLSLFSDMQFNLYLPKVEGIEILEVTGEGHLAEETVNINGVEMFVIYGMQKVEDFTPVKATVKYKENGVLLEHTVTLDTLEYATIVAKSFECGSDEACLVYEIMKYKEAVAKYLNIYIGNDAKRLEDFFSIFKSHKNCRCATTSVNISEEEKATDISSLAAVGVNSVTYIISADTIGMVMDVDGDTQVSSVSYTDALGNEIIHTVQNGNLVKNGNRYIATGISASYIDEIMTITVGETKGTFCLGKYIEQKPDVAVAKNIYKYAIAAENYIRFAISEVTVSVDEVKKNGFIGENYYVEGYCVAVTGESIDIRCINSDEIITVRNTPAGYEIGDKIVILATLQNDGEKYLAYSNENPSDVSETVKSSGNDVTHAHTYDSAWLTELSATIFNGGVEYRVCTHNGCSVKESRATEKLEVTGISITNLPTKTAYDKGDVIDLSGLTVEAYTCDGISYDVTKFISISKVILEIEDEQITVSYAGFSSVINIRVFVDRTSVSVLAESGVVGNKYTVEGYYVGVSDEGIVEASVSSSYAGNREILIKDKETDAIIAVRNVPYGEYPSYGYKYGDEVLIVATYYESENTNTPNKNYLDFSVQDNPDSIEGTIISRDNDVTYDFDEITTIDSWEEWKALFDDATIENYSYIKIKSEFLYAKRESHKTADEKTVYAWRIHPNATATSNSSIKTDDRWITLNEPVMNANLGSSVWKGYFESLADTDERYNGTTRNRLCLADEVIVLYVGACKNYFTVTVLDEYWFYLDEDAEQESYTNADAVVEVANAFHRKENYIWYNQTMSRRHINPSPEEATAQNQLYLDCSSFVNAVYYEAFGVNVMPYAVDEKINGVTQTPQTGRFRNYARDNQGNPDVVGYWNIANYDGDIPALLLEIRDLLQVGDVISYRRAGDGSGHALMYIGGTSFIHCSGGDYEEKADASQSYDSGGENVNGGAIDIDKTYMNKLFVDPDNGRYLGVVHDISVIRPLARGLTPTEKTVARMENPGLDVSKTVDAGVNSAVYKNSTITYTVTVKNHSASIQNLNLQEIIDDNVTFVSGSKRAVVDGNTLSWNVRIGAGSTITITWTVRVKSSAQAGDIIDGTNTTVNGVGIAKNVNTVSAYTSEQMAMLAERAKEYAKESKCFDDPIAMARLLYKEVFGVEILGEDIESAKYLLEDIIKKGLNTESSLYEMVAPYLYGGCDVSSVYVKSNDVVRLITQANISVGDVIVAYDESEERTVVYVYVGDSTLIAVNSADKTCKVITMTDSPYESSHVLVTLFAYDKYVILRPSMK